MLKGSSPALLPFREWPQGLKACKRTFLLHRALFSLSTNRKCYIILKAFHKTGSVLRITVCVSQFHEKHIKLFTYYTTFIENSRKKRRILIIFRKKHYIAYSKYNVLPQLICPFRLPLPLSCCESCKNKDKKIRGFCSSLYTFLSLPKDS